MFTQIIRDPSTEVRMSIYESLQIAFPNNVLVSWLQFSMHHRYTYLDAALWTVSIGFVSIRQPSAIFVAVCESLSALTECVYNSKLYACLSLNIQ